MAGAPARRGYSPGPQPGDGRPKEVGACAFLESLGPHLLFPGLLLHLLLLAQHRPLLRELDVVDGYVDLGDPQADQVLHAVDHVAAHRLGDLRDRHAILDGHREVYGRLLLTDLDRDAATEVAPARATAGHALQETPDCGGRATAHLDFLDLLRRDAGDLGDHGVAYGGAAAFAPK